jgi:hypothetical protein
LTGRATRQAGCAYVASPPGSMLPVVEGFSHLGVRTLSVSCEVDRRIDHHLPACRGARGTSRSG